MTDTNTLLALFFAMFAVAAVACFVFIKAVLTQKSEIINLRALLEASTRNELHYFQKMGTLERQLEDARQNMRTIVDKEVAKSVGAQRSTIKGQLAEQLYPMLDFCPYLPSDMRFLGAPIDYIIFKGYTDTKDGEGHVEEVIFAEIKTGNATLSRHQRSIRDAIERGAVRWETIVL